MEKLLGRFMSKKVTATTMASDYALIGAVFEADDDLSSWEIVDASDDSDDEAEDYSFSDDGDDDGISVLEPISSVLLAQSSPRDLIPEDSAKHLSIYERFVYNYRDVEEEEEEEAVAEEEEEEEEDGGYGDEYDLDDELVPKSVSDRLGRQRMRKVGKRAYPKMNKSKRLPYHYNRPGCVHGKHGLGLKHNIFL